ncbi:MAG: MFS transporter [Lautropia sp.]
MPKPPNLPNQPKLPNPPIDADAFSLRAIALPAFGPSLLYGIANGAMLPVIALSAYELGASTALAGLIVALSGIGALVSNLPAAMITTAFGERRAMLGAAAVSVAGLLLCIFAVGPWMLAAGVLLTGMAGAVFWLARQTFLIEVTPFAMRAQALSTLAGSMRIGAFVGPFAGAALIHFLGLSGAYWIALIAMVGVGWIATIVPDLGVDQARQAEPVARPSFAGIFRSHAGVLLTLGFGVLLVSALRSARPVVVPLWATHLGLEPAVVSIVYGLASAVDMAVFYPAGKVMDRHGRIWVALPCVLLMGGSLLWMPLTNQLTTFVAASLLLGLGNGIGSGIVMTLGADSSPRAGRAEFLGLWRILADIGSCGGPVLLSVVTAAISLTAGITTIGALGFVAAAVFWRWLPLPRRR